MPRLFSYGSLQRAEVQVATFGRELVGTRDELAGWRLVPARAGSPHANVRRAAPDARVPGTVFAVTDAELAAADVYERRDGYARVAAALVSGGNAWVYADELSLRDAPG